MKALVLNQRNISLEQRPEPVVLAGETLLAIHYAGICETDLQLLKGYIEFSGTPGHEFVATALSGPWAGTRVVGDINCACRECATCQAGQTSHCPSRTVLGIVQRDGAFAQQMTLPQYNLHRVPDAVSDVQAVFVEPVAAAFNILERVEVGANDRVVVVGDGRLGNVCAQVLALRSRHVTVIGKHPRKLALLARRGIDTRLLDDAERLPQAEIVVECAGSVSGWETAIKLVKPRGALVLKTTVAAQHTLSLAPVVIHEVRVIGSRCGPFPPALDALARRLIDVEPLVEDIYPLTQGVEALRRAATEPVLKLLLDCRL